MSLLFRVGESLLIYVDALTACISDAWVQEIVFKGYIVVFHSMPSPVSSSLPVSRKSLSSTLGGLLGQGGIVQVPVAEWFQGFQSNLFIPPRPKEGIRSILDLKTLNVFFPVHKFHM